MNLTRATLFLLRKKHNIGELSSLQRGYNFNRYYSMNNEKNLNTQEGRKSKLQLTPDGKLTWNDYFALRRRRRLSERIITIPTTIGGFGLSIGYVATREFDPTPILGQEPFLIYGIGTILCGFTGLLVGPIVGSSIWKLFHREEVKLMEQRDREFFEHVKKNRADPSLHTLRNPAPDYYGEKIKSVQDYRKWLRKQREIVRKGTFHLGEEDDS
ncbi:9963_t:CDS:2 [Diversispora eburnea]|uniref:Presequence translocated-associated motor subunit PAM17 n=1 Tax=Diversispora eburnea TaxID=1213867 RepID=A0A9N8ZD34_9GLOM|nr:9963_t:CDS:2 [Diversispora eburnea]